MIGFNLTGLSVTMIIFPFIARLSADYVMNMLKCVCDGNIFLLKVCLANIYKAKSQLICYTTFKKDLDHYTSL